MWHFQPEIWFILNAKGEEVTGGRFCAVVLGGQCGEWEDVNSWTIPIPGNKPDVITPTPPPVSRKVQNVVDLKFCYHTLTLAPYIEVSNAHPANSI